MGKTTIDRRWLPLNALRAFEGVAKHSSFTAAANALLISQSALSRHVIALEKLIGAQLFERRPHALVLTKAGQHLLPAVHEILRPPGVCARRHPQRRLERRCARLRVQMPPSFAVHLAVPILRDFRRAAAEVEIDLVSPYGVGPPPSDVDVAVVYSKPTVTDMVTDLLWPVHLSVLCHPNIAARACRQELWREFIESNELVHVRISDLPRHHLWTQFARQANLGAVHVERGLVFDNVMLAVQYALSGEGIALGRYLSVRRLHSHRPPGQTVRELLWMMATAITCITHPEALSDTAIALFRSWLIERFGTARRSVQPAPSGFERVIVKRASRRLECSSQSIHQ